jgi:hypothetical protein
VQRSRCGSTLLILEGSGRARRSAREDPHGIVRSALLLAQALADVAAEEIEALLSIVELDSLVFLRGTSGCELQLGPSEARSGAGNKRQLPTARCVTSLQSCATDSSSCAFAAPALHIHIRRERESALAREVTCVPVTA